jgi:hypothetical protein
MNLSEHGNDILTNNQVTNISNLGFWIIIEQNEYFVPFKHYPIFKNATVEQIYHFEMLSPGQLYWKSLDCDIEVDALENPQQFSLIYK